MHELVKPEEENDKNVHEQTNVNDKEGEVKTVDKEDDICDALENTDGRNRALSVNLIEVRTLLFITKYKFVEKD